MQTNPTLEEAEASNNRIAVIGCGPVGSTLAVMLCNQGYSVDIFEKREDPTALDEKDKVFTVGRSMNLGLSFRGMQSLELIDAHEIIYS